MRRQQAGRPWAPAARWRRLEALQRSQPATACRNPLPQEVWDDKEGYCLGLDAGGNATRVESFSGRGGK